MPSKHKRLVSLDGTEEYAKFLRRLAKAVRADGVPIADDELLKLAEHAFARLGEHYGLVAPRRVPPHGTNRHGEPKDAG